MRSSFLSGVMNPLKEYERYQGAIKLADDEQTRQKYTKALQALQQNIDRLHSITTELDQADTLLDSVGNDIEVTLAEVSQMQSVSVKESSGQDSRQIGRNALIWQAGRYRRNMTHYNVPGTREQ